MWILILAILLNGHIEIFAPIIYSSEEKCMKKMNELIAIDEERRKKEGISKNDHVDIFCLKAI